MERITEGGGWDPCGSVFDLVAAGYLIRGKDLILIKGVAFRVKLGLLVMNRKEGNSNSSRWFDIECRYMYSILIPNVTYHEMAKRNRELTIICGNRLISLSFNAKSGFPPLVAFLDQFPGVTLTRVVRPALFHA